MTNAQTVYQDLIGAGLSPAAATGVVGNLVAESGVDPKSVQSGGPGRGIAQWSAGGRWDQLLAWVRQTSNGRADPLALNSQEAFMIQEMKAMGVWDQLKSVSDSLTAAGLVMRKYEMPADQSNANAAHRAALGAQAVKDVSLLDQVKNIPGDILNKIKGTATDAASSAGSAAVSAAKPLVFEGLFILLGLGLVALGTNKAFDIRGRANAARAGLAQAVI
jgi:hypothetical protein